MSGGGVRDVLFDYPAIIGSRMGAQLGRTFHIPALTAEAKENEKNPGRAETKAAINAALYFAGSAAGSAFGSGAGAAADGVGGYADAGVALDQANAANAAMQAGGAAGGLLGNVSGGGSELTAEELAKATAQQQLTNGVASSGAIPTVKQVAQEGASNNAGLLAHTAYRMVPGVGSQQAQMLADQTADFGPYGLGKTMEAASNAQGLNPVQSFFGNYGGKALDAFHQPKGMVGKMALNMGTKMLTPQPRQQMPQGMPAPQGPQGPLPNPYQNNTYGPGGNSMGLTEDQKRRLRAMGYQIP